MFLKLFRIILTALFLLVANTSFAYQTVTMDFPGNWYKINYMNNDNDAIVQFIRRGYDASNWQESVVFHTFKWSKARSTTAKSLMLSLLNDVNKKNSTMKVQFHRLDTEDTLSSWCVQATKTMPAHCEVLRTTQSFDGALSIHYINKDPKNFMSVREDWLDRISKARVYQSYYRLDRILNKSMTFEL